MVIEDLIKKTICIYCGKWTSTSLKDRVHISINLPKGFTQESIAGVCKNCKKDWELEEVLIR